MRNVVTFLKSQRLLAVWSAVVGTQANSGQPATQGRKGTMKILTLATIGGFALFVLAGSVIAGDGNPVTKTMKGSFAERVIISAADHFDELACGGSPFAHSESTAVGQVRHLGRTTAYVNASWDWSVSTAADPHADMLVALGGYTFCDDGKTPSNTLMFTAENGDEVYADITGGRVNELCAGGGLEIIIEYTVMAGTGRFEGATGFGTGTTRVNFVDGCEGDAAGFIFSEFDGTIYGVLGVGSEQGATADDCSLYHSATCDPPDCPCREGTGGSGGGTGHTLVIESPVEFGGPPGYSAGCPVGQTHSQSVKDVHSCNVASECEKVSHNDVSFETCCRIGHCICGTGC